MKNQIEKIVALLNEADSNDLRLVNNVYCSEKSFDDDEIFTNDDEFLQMTFGNNVTEAVRACCYGEYRYNDEFVKFNGYGNLVSLNYVTTNDLVESLEIIAEHILENSELYSDILDLDFLNDDDDDIKIIRKVDNYSLCKKGNYYYIDNGIDDVSFEFDDIEADELVVLPDSNFLKDCKNYF